jgi:hypothetical protein
MLGWNQNQLKAEWGSRLIPNIFSSCIYLDVLGDGEFVHTARSLRRS